MNNKNTLVDPLTAARALGVDIPLLRYWRGIGKGPEFRRLGRNTIRYRWADLEAFAGCELSLPAENDATPAAATA